MRRSTTERQQTRKLQRSPFVDDGDGHKPSTAPLASLLNASHTFNGDRPLPGVSDSIFLQQGRESLGDTEKGIDCTNFMARASPLLSGRCQLHHISPVDRWQHPHTASVSSKKPPGVTLHIEAASRFKSKQLQLHASNKITLLQ